LAHLQQDLALTPKAIQALQDLLPYGVIVKNNSPISIASIVVLYHITNPQGKPVYAHVGLSASYAGDPNVMRPGEVRFLCPAFSVAMAINNHTLTLPFNDRQLKIIRQDMAPEISQTSIRVALDSVIFETGELVGPDVANSLDKYAQWRRAEDELASGLAQYHGAELMNFLESISSQPLPSGLEYFAVRLQFRARSDLRRLKEQGEAELRNYAQSEKPLVVFRRSQ
jgi:hypothetical protein